VNEKCRNPSRLGLISRGSGRTLELQSLLLGLMDSESDEHLMVESCPLTIARLTTYAFHATARLTVS
jgi:hypothetical protein